MSTITIFRSHAPRLPESSPPTGEVALLLSIIRVSRERCSLSAVARNLPTMAGGMTAGRGEPLAQRSANTRARQHPEPTRQGALKEMAPIRHCWYGGQDGQRAALLLTWRRTGTGASGRIAVAAPDPTGWALVEMWGDARLLTLAGRVSPQ